MLPVDWKSARVATAGTGAPVSLVRAQRFTPVTPGTFRAIARAAAGS
jgi:hypothetical protein